MGHIGRKVGEWRKRDGKFSAPKRASKRMVFVHGVCDNELLMKTAGNRLNCWLIITGVFFID
jgi:hypothetical protein